jgi:hypothetical protein
VPAVGLALLGVDGQDHAAVPGDRGVRLGEDAQKPGEGSLVGIGGVLLIAQEDDLVPEQRGAQLGHGGGADVPADPDAADDGTDHPAHLGDVDVLVRAMTAESRRMVLDAGHRRAPFGWLVPGSRRHHGAGGPARVSYQQSAPASRLMSSIPVGFI